tara:strand:- start:63 stop:302 length:240 start_codon:yes stop_codon:yes gene_type:complete
MIITAHITLDPKGLESIHASSSHIGTIKDIADHDFGIDLEWTDEYIIKIEGKMSAITMLAEEWQPTSLTLVSFTEDDEL